jgi:hypothetical protein
LLRRIEFQLIQPNAEINAAAIWQGLEQRREQIHAQRTIVSHENSHGLDKTAAVEQIEEAAASGNQRVKLAGKDVEGNPLQGDNDKLRVQTEMDLPQEDAAKAQLLANKYQTFVRTGFIRPDQPDGAQTAILENLLDTWS